MLYIKPPSNYYYETDVVYKECSIYVAPYIYHFFKSIDENFTVADRYICLNYQLGISFYKDSNGILRYTRPENTFVYKLLKLLYEENTKEKYISFEEEILYQYLKNIEANDSSVFTSLINENKELKEELKNYKEQYNSFMEFATNNNIIYDEKTKKWNYKKYEEKDGRFELIEVD